MSALSRSSCLALRPVFGRLGPPCLALAPSSRRWAYTKTPVEYRQGQWINNVREYFYYIDHNGQLFLDDARMKNFTSCFKDKRFLGFFFWRLKPTPEGDKYLPHFPYISPCGKECNYVRAEDRPIVFTSLDKPSNSLFYNHSDKSALFEPTKLCMFPNGRLYHPSRFGGFGLVSDKLADDFFHDFVYDDAHNPVKIRWDDQVLDLTQELAAKYVVVGEEEEKKDSTRDQGQGRF